MARKRKQLNTAAVDALRRSDDGRKVLCAVGELLQRARFAGEPLDALPAKLVDIHPDSICSVNLRDAVRLRELLKSHT